MISVGQQLAGLSSKAKAARVIPSTVHIYKPFHVCLCKVSLVFCTTLPALYRQSSRRLVSSALKYLPSSKKKSSCSLKHISAQSIPSLLNAPCRTSCLCCLLPHPFKDMLTIVDELPLGSSSAALKLNNSFSHEKQILI